MIETRPETVTDQAAHSVAHRLVEAGLIEFAARGFEGASTRQMAILADTHQPQINYHFGSKTGLWKACLEKLVNELDDEIELRFRELNRPDAVAEFEATIRALVAFAARRPELNRIMMQEGSAPSERLDWLVETHLSDRYQAMSRAWAALPSTSRVTGLPPSILYHTLIGSASLLYANSPEAELLGIDVTQQDLIEKHADALVEMFVGRSKRSKGGPNPNQASEEQA